MRSEGPVSGAMADEICAIVDGLERDDSRRRDRYLTNLRLYELRALNGLHAQGYYTNDYPADDAVVVPILRSLCDTVHADIAGRQRPVPMFMTSGASWHTRRRAKKLGKFVEAVLHQPQGRYVNGWSVATEAFLDCEIYGVGILHVYVSEIDGKVIIERVQPDEITVDPREAESGEPRNFFRTYLMDEDQVYEEFLRDDADSDDEADDDKGPKLDKYGDAEAPADLEARRERHERDSRRALLRAAIERASTNDNGLRSEQYGSTRIARSVRIREALRLPISEDKPGLHAYCVPGAVLHKEEWTRKHDPYVFMYWSRERRGFWGISLIDEARKLAAEVNRTFLAMQERMVLCANRRVFIPDSAQVTDEQMQANEAENLIRYAGGQAPTETSVPALNPADFQWAQFGIQLTHESPGVSQMSATGQRPSGVNAAVAMRTLQDVAAKRFAVKARESYEMPFVDLARKIVAAVAEYVERTGKDISVRLPQRRGVSEIKWSDVKMDEELDVQIAPASSLPNDPAGRLATVQDLFNAQVIGPMTFKRLLDWPDIEQEMSRDGAEWEYVESRIEAMLDAEEGKLDDYVPPDGLLVRKENALLQVSGAYFEARRDGAPEWNLGLLRRYMKAISRMIEAAAQMAQQMTTGAPGTAAAAPATPASSPASPGAPNLTAVEAA